MSPDDASKIVGAFYTIPVSCILKQDLNKIQDGIKKGSGFTETYVFLGITGFVPIVPMAIGIGTVTLRIHIF